MVSQLIGNVTGIVNQVVQAVPPWQRYGFPSQELYELAGSPTISYTEWLTRPAQPQTFTAGAAATKAFDDPARAVVTPPKPTPNPFTAGLNTDLLNKAREQTGPSLPQPEPIAPSATQVASNFDTGENRALSMEGALTGYGFAPGPAYPVPQDPGLFGRALGAAGDVAGALGATPLAPVLNSILPGLGLANAGVEALRGQPTTVNDAVALYNTDIPVVSDFMRGTGAPALGEAAGAVAQAMPGIGPGLAIANRLSGGLVPTAEDVGRFVGETAAPVTAGDFFLESIPGVGMAPDLVRGGRRLVDDLGRGLYEAVEDPSVLRGVMSEDVSRVVGGGVPDEDDLSAQLEASLRMTPDEIRAQQVTSSPQPRAAETPAAPQRQLSDDELRAISKQTGLGLTALRAGDPLQMINDEIEFLQRAYTRAREELARLKANPRSGPAYASALEFANKSANGTGRRLTALGKARSSITGEPYKFPGSTATPQPRAPSATPTPETPPASVAPDEDDMSARLAESLRLIDERGREGAQQAFREASGAQSRPDTFAEARAAGETPRTPGEARAAVDRLRATRGEGITPGREQSIRTLLEEMGEGPGAAAAAARRVGGQAAGDAPDALPSIPLEDALRYVRGEIDELPGIPAEAIAAPREVPRPSTALPGSAAKGPPGWAADAGLPPRAGDALNYFVQERRSILGGMPRNPNRIQRAATMAATGVDDPWLAEEIASELELGDFLRHVLSDEPDLDVAAIIHEMRPKFRDLMIADRFKNKKAAREALQRLHANDIERAQTGVASKYYDTVNNLLRTMLLGIEVPLGFAGQQGLRTLRGAPAIGTGVIARLVPGLRRQLYTARDVDYLAQLVADGAQFGKRGATADISQDVLQRVPYLGDALDWVSTVQFEHALGSLRLRAIEGLLLQNWALHKISRGLLGGDITKPEVRRRIMEFGNTLGSTARPAVGAKRAATEQRGILSPRMTRAQVNELMTVVKAPRSAEDRVNLMNLILGTGLMFAAANELNQQIGIGDLVMDPLDSMFGRMTLDARNAKGENIITDFLPQASLFRTVMRTVDAFTERDWEKMAQAWTRFAVGRLGPLLSAALAAGGFGYGREGKFYYGEMPMEERWRAVVPAPVGIQGAIFDGEHDPISLGLSLTGNNSYGESEFFEQRRLAEEDFGKDLFDLLPYERAQQNLKVMQSRELLPEEHAAPLMYAGSSAFGVIQEQVFNGEHNLGGQEQFVLDFESSAQAREAYVEMLSDPKSPLRAKYGVPQEVVLRQDQALDDWYGFLNAMGYDGIVRQMREEVIRTDPTTVQSLYEAWLRGETRWEPAKWMWELADEVRSGR